MSVATAVEETFLFLIVCTCEGRLFFSSLMFKRGLNNDFDDFSWAGNCLLNEVLLVIGRYS